MASSKPPTPAAALTGGSFSQTLSRGLRVLEVLADADGPLSVVDLSAALGMHRSVVYRLVRTLEEHKLVTAEPDGRYVPGYGLMTLARGVGRDMRASAAPVLERLAEDLGATAFLGVADGDEVVCLVSVEPQSALLRIRYRQGLRHPITKGATGHAMLSVQPPEADEQPLVRQARRLGYAVSKGELEVDTVAVSAPVRGRGSASRSAVTVLFPHHRVPDEHDVGHRVIRAAAEIERMLP